MQQASSVHPPPALKEKTSCIPSRLPTATIETNSNISFNTGLVLSAFSSQRYCFARRILSNLRGFTLPKILQPQLLVCRWTESSIQGSIPNS